MLVTHQRFIEEGNGHHLFFNKIGKVMTSVNDFATGGLYGQVSTALSNTIIGLKKR